MLKRITLFVILALLSACEYNSGVEITKDNTLIHKTYFQNGAQEKFIETSCYSAIKKNSKIKVLIDTAEEFKVEINLLDIPNIIECEEYLVQNTKGLVALGRPELSGSTYHSNVGNIDYIRKRSNSTTVYLVSKHNDVTKFELRNEFEISNGYRVLEEDTAYLIIDTANSNIATIKTYVDQFPKAKD